MPGSRTFWDYRGFYRVYIGIIRYPLGLCSVLGLFWDNGEENVNYYIVGVILG